MTKAGSPIPVWSPSDVGPVDALWRAANYLAVAQIYLCGNCLLEQPLKPEHIKPRLLGHWGTVPGIGFVYSHLNRLIRATDASMMLVTGPGHGAPANLAHLYLEGTLADYYPAYTLDRDGLSKLVEAFSWPGGFPSHLTPGTPGTIHEGGELGYALATAFGAAFDNPDLIVACIVGDGEAETGPTAAAWHSTKFLDPIRDGAVLPILHVNGYKISSRTISGSMDDGELHALYTGYGYEPLFMEVSLDHPESPEAFHGRMGVLLDGAYATIRRIQEQSRSGAPVIKPKWPMIVLRTPKGWTGLKSVDGHLMTGSSRTHQVPVDHPRTKPEHLLLLGEWLASYVPAELFDAEGRPNRLIQDAIPRLERRMGANPHANGGTLRVELNRPDFHAYAVKIRERGADTAADTAILGGYLRDVVRQNPDNFLIVCPDEMSSNRLSTVFEATPRQYEWPVSPDDPSIAQRGRVLEILSEHTCQAWLQGYLLTGRHGLFPCYEAFVSIVDSMMGQYAKFLKQSGEVAWRKPVSSLTYLLSSEGWRQDHNGFSHQMPGFINVLLNKKAAHVRVYLPPDANSLLSTIDHCLTSTGKINVVIASKQPMPQWLDSAEAAEHCRAGISVWKWASTEDAGEPDVILAASGVYPTAELMAAVWLLRRDLPGLRIRVVNVTDLLVLEPASHHPHGLTPAVFEAIFPRPVPVVFNFHGYPSAVKQLLFDRPGADRFAVNGYVEEGTTTTPFSLLAANGIDRFTVAMQAIEATAGLPVVRERAPALIADYLSQRKSALHYAIDHGEDSQSITEWKWNLGKPA